MRTSILASVVLLVGLMGCTDDVPDPRPQISTQGLGQPCPTEGCATDQACVTAAGPGGETRSCEIRCEADRDCPLELVCNLPPVVPDSIVKVCVDR